MVSRFLATDWDDDEPFIYWRNWTSDNNNTNTGSVPRGKDYAAGLRRQGAFRRRDTSSSRGGRGRGQYVSGRIPKKETGRGAADAQPPKLPPLQVLSRPDPLLVNWVSSPVPPLTAALTTTPPSHDKSSIGPVSECGVVLSVVRIIPKITVTPPTPAVTRKGEVGKDEEEPVVTGHDVFDAESDDVRDMLRKEWREYVWGGWVGE